jgi:hypothetical protein
MPLHSFKCTASVVLLKWNSSKIKMAAGGHLDIHNDHNVPGINGNRTLNKMTPVRCKSGNRLWSYRIYCVLASYHFMDGKMRGGKLICSRNSRQIQSWAKWRQPGVDISNGSKAITFSNVGLKKFKTAAGGQNGGIFRRCLGRFLMSRFTNVLHR